MNIFEPLKEFPRIAVTGPQRSGTRICAKMIAEDLGYSYVDERSIGVNSTYRFLEAMQIMPVVIQCPGMCRWIHHFGAANKDLAVVLMRRGLEDIIASQERIQWEFEPVERLPYEQFIEGTEIPPIAELKYAYWEQVQKKMVLNVFEINYEDLKSHPMWIPKKRRAKFHPAQTSDA